VKTYAATHNAGKRRELAAIFAGSPLKIAAYRRYGEVVEDAPTYLGNAILKARALAQQLREAGVEGAVLADDSGLEVAALAGRPGLFSARYGGEDLTWAQRRALLLEELRGVPPGLRKARFVCALALVMPAGEMFTAIGEVEGIIAERETGSGGFGYDALFLYLPARRTFAQLAQKEKNAVSHRRHAADALLAAIGPRV